MLCGGDPVGHSAKPLLTPPTHAHLLYCPDHCCRAASTRLQPTLATTPCITAKWCRTSMPWSARTGPGSHVSQPTPSGPLQLGILVDDPRKAGYGVAAVNMYCGMLKWVAEQVRHEVGI